MTDDRDDLEINLTSDHSGSGRTRSGRKNMERVLENNRRRINWGNNRKQRRPISLAGQDKSK